MDYAKELEKYTLSLDADAISRLEAEAALTMGENMTRENFINCFSCLDLTSLNHRDSNDSIDVLASKIAQFPIKYPDLPNVASFCVYPCFVDVAGLALGNSSVAITSVSGGFPSSQTFLEVKMLETAMAAESGADELDVVLNLGEFLDGDLDTAASELEMLKGELDDDLTLKVILETGELSSDEQIYRAAILAMLAGADFIKTSTGKTKISATPRAVVVMCQAIKDFNAMTAKQVGIKVAGGVRTCSDAILYQSIVRYILGEDYLEPSLFRLGASVLADNLLSEITGQKVAFFS